LSIVRDADGHETRYEYDALSRLVKQIDPLGGIVSYTYLCSCQRLGCGLEVGDGDVGEPGRRWGHPSLC
jgi:YD repeat-containing protein